MARHIVIATAGHVDHGKTTLVKALTGIETDTMAEEKRRGLTINLGFAYLDLPDGRRIGIVDVPGHEKFIKNMVAGLPGIHLVLLVIDANEGVMPQTIEHLDILSLLGVRNYLIVITKIDTVGSELRSLVRQDIEEQLAGTAAAGAPIIETDAVTGTGLSALVEKIQEMTAQVPDSRSDGKGRMNIDRVFSVKGFGTVVTGTLLDGPVAIGDTLYVYPDNCSVRVRNIQIHEHDVDRAEPYQRTALNLANIDVKDLQRGDVISASPDLAASWMLDVTVKVLGHSPVPIRLWDRLRLLIGTKEVICRVVPIGLDALQPGQTGFVQLRMEREQVIAEGGDHFILRSFSPMHTIAGGEILDAHPKKHRRFKDDVVKRLEDLAAGEGSHLVEQERRGYAAQCQKALSVLTAYHKKYPLRKGMAMGAFRARLGKGISKKGVTALLYRFVRDGICRVEDKIVAAADFTVTFTPDQLAERRAIATALEKGGYGGVKVTDLPVCGDGAVLDSMKGDGAVFLTPEYVVSSAWYDKAVQAVQGWFQDHESITLAQCRDLLGTNRNATLRLLDYMDSRHITQRTGDVRILF